MRVLFVVSDFFLGEPMGVLQLSAILKQERHQIKLLGLKKHPLTKVLAQYEPDIIAYSTLSPEANLFKEADFVIRNWAQKKGKEILRIMGGPHPTYFPEVLGEMELDAICIGEGDNAIRKIVRKYAAGEPLSNISNVLIQPGDINEIQKELISDLDSLPFVDRDAYYEAMPYYNSLGLRGFMVGRGCPYNCTYCHNHAFRKTFRGHGKFLRRRSVDHIIEEMKYVIHTYPTVRQIKISDDVFVHTIDDWLLEFIEKYKKEIGLPFYCLMRSNTLTEEMARLLSSAGCVSIGMSVEHGDERVRNDVLKRRLSDKVVRNSFEYARKYGIKTFGNTLLAIPGTTFEDDIKSFLFTKNLKMTAPTFGIFKPYPRTELTEYAIKNGYLEPNYDGNNAARDKSPLNCFTDNEKDMQLRLVYLAPLFCHLPDLMIPMLKFLLKINILRIYKTIGSAYIILKTGFHIFPGIYPSNPFKFLKLFLDSIKYYAPRKELAQTEALQQDESFIQRFSPANRHSG